MQPSIQLSIPVKPYIAKFLSRHLGDDYQLSKTDIYGRYLHALLRSPLEDRQYDKHLDQYKKEFRIEIPMTMFGDRACRYFSSFTIVDFNGFAEGIFFFEFNTFVKFRIAETRCLQKDAIMSFCRLHNLTEDDITFETLKKNWQRFKNK